MGVSTVLTIVFVVLKLTHTIGWPWIWVLSPLWISFGFALLLLLVVVVPVGLVSGLRRSGRGSR
jgi:membrane protein YdbS with pleckstrin-like domain